MANQIRTITILIALCLLFALPGCNNSNAHKVEIEEIKADLARAESQRDGWKIKNDAVTRERDALKKKTDELIESRGTLEMQINGLTAARDAIQRQFTEIAASRDKWQARIDELTKAKNDALDAAKEAQAQVDEL